MSKANQTAKKEFLKANARVMTRHARRAAKKPGGYTTVEIEVDPTDPDETTFIQALRNYTENPELGVIVYFDCSVEPYDPGVCVGSPERCYPPEGGEVEITDVYVMLEGRQVDLPEMLARDLEEHFKTQVTEQATEQVEEEVEEYDPYDY